MSRPIEVPAGTLPKLCKADICRAPIYWIETKTGKWMPVDCAPKHGGTPPTEERAGSGVPHWATCPAAPSFRRSR